MSITKIVTVPTDLPHAHLYLDDLEQICQILSESVQAGASNPNHDVTVSFRTKDLQMDSIDDLKSYGGSSTDLRIEIGGRQSLASASIAFHSLSEPTIYLYLPDIDAKWAAYSRIKAVFDTRQMLLKNAWAQLPFWLQLTLWAFGVISVL